MNITFTRNELCELLEVSNDNLKKICKRGKLEERLELKGYKLVKEYKYGKSIIYDVEPCNIDEWLTLQKKYKVTRECEKPTPLGVGWIAKQCKPCV